MSFKEDLFDNGFTTDFYGYSVWQYKIHGDMEEKTSIVMIRGNINGDMFDYGLFLIDDDNHSIMLDSKSVDNISSLKLEVYNKLLDLSTVFNFIASKWNL